VTRGGTTVVVSGELVRSPREPREPQREPAVSVLRYR
jgi:hypothetical protein